MPTRVRLCRLPATSAMVSLFLCAAAFLVTARIAVAGEKTLDEVPIQRQIDAVGEKGGVVKLEARTYTVAKAIVLRDNVTLKGAGMDKTVIRLADGANPESTGERIPFANRCVIRNENYDELAAPQGNHDITICDLTIDGNAANNTDSGEGVFLANCYSYRIANVHAMNCRGFAGIYTNPCHAAARKKIKYSNYILNCIVEGQQPATDRDAPYGHGFYVTAPDNDNVLLKGCIARNNRGAGIHGEDFICHFLVEDNEVYGNGRNGIWFCEVRNSVIRKNNVHHNGGGGIHLSQGKGNRDNLVCGNDIHHNSGHGIALTRQYAPGDSSCSIANNHIWNNRGAGIFISSSARRNTVTGNHCYDDRDAGADRQTYGILVDSAGNTIVDNRVHGNAKRGIKAAAGNSMSQ